MKPTPKYLKSIEPENWNFEDVEEAQLEECLLYEVAREWLEIRARIERFRKFARGTTFDELLSRGLSKARLARRSADWKGIAPFCPEFPETPFLKIPIAERNRRIGLYRPRQSAEFEAIFFQHDLRDLFMYFDERDVENGIVRTPHGLVVAAFNLCLSETETEIVEKFRNWLQVFGPRLTKLPRVITRGAGSKIRQLKKSLKALGAFRLLRAFENQRLASDHSAEHRRNRHPLYRDQGAWSRARREALTLLRHYAS